VRLDDEVAAILGDGGAELFARPTSQAFPLLTVDAGGRPHVCLLCAAQLAVLADRQEIALSIAGRTTCENLRARPVATLVAIGGTTAHYLKGTVVRDVTVEGRAGFVLHVDDHKADSAGVELSPVLFRFSPELAIEERWSRDAAVLRALAGAGSGPEGD
jgi:hypothetical protein